MDGLGLVATSGLTQKMSINLGGKNKPDTNLAQNHQLTMLVDCCKSKVATLNFSFTSFFCKRWCEMGSSLGTLIYGLKMGNGLKLVKE